MVTDIVGDAKLRSMSAKGGAGGKMDDLLRWNNLRYQMPVTNSVISARNLKRYPADRAEYDYGATGTHNPGPIFFHIQSGEHYVDWAKSFIELKLNAEIVIQPSEAGSTAAKPNIGSATTGNIGAQFVTFGQGSICNLIDEVIVSTRSGTEIYRCEEFGRWRAMQDMLTRKDDWFSSVGEMLGYQPLGVKNALANSSYGNNEGIQYTGYIPTYSDVSLDGTTGVATATFDRKFCIPLDMLGGPFATGQLSPAVLAGGLVIELRLSPLLECFCGMAQIVVASGVFNLRPIGTQISASTANKISDLFLHLDTHLLNDQAMRSLTQTASSSGLEITYEQPFHQQASSPSTSLDLVCSKAVSRALTVIGGFYDTGTLDFGRVDKYAPSVADKGKVASYQWRLGSQYFPHVKLEAPATQFFNLLYTLESIDDETKAKSLTQSMFEKQFRYICATFERSSLLKYSGSAINNSRTLSLSATTTGTGAQFHFWLHHLTVAKTFLNNCVVSI